MHRIWKSVRQVVVGRFGTQDRPEGYGRELNPTWELGWFKGELVLMGKNQTMRMLLQTPHAGARQSLLGGPRRHVGAQKA